MAESLYKRCLEFDADHFDALNNLATLESEVKENHKYAAELLERSLEVPAAESVSIASGLV